MGSCNDVLQSGPQFQWLVKLAGDLRHANEYSLVLQLDAADCTDHWLLKPRYQLHVPISSTRTVRIAKAGQSCQGAQDRSLHDGSTAVWHRRECARRREQSQTAHRRPHPRVEVSWKALFMREAEGSADEDVLLRDRKHLCGARTERGHQPRQAIANRGRERGVERRGEDRRRG